MIKPDKPFFRQKVEGKLWKTVVSEDREHMVWEDRDEENHKVSFGLYDLKNREVALENINLSERWWATVAAVNSNWIVFEHYEDAENPQKKKVTVFDIGEERVIQEVDDSYFESISETEVLIKKDISANKVYSIKKASVTEASRQSVTTKPSADLILQPFHYEQGSDYAKTVQQFLGSKLGIEALDVFDYMEHEEYLLISYYCKSELGMANYLLSGLKDSSEWVKILLADGISGIGSDTFWIIDDQLFFVQNKNTLLGYDF